MQAQCSARAHARARLGARPRRPGWPGHARELQAWQLFPSVSSKQRFSGQRQWGQVLQGSLERGLRSWEGSHLFSLINDPGLVDHASPCYSWLNGLSENHKESVKSELIIFPPHLISSALIDTKITTRQRCFSEGVSPSLKGGIFLMASPVVPHPGQVADARLLNFRCLMDLFVINLF